jgi:MFS transporter, PAT family, beta-lactamase induction signal transducer AmpG
MDAPESRKFNPWTFIPVLYITQAIPVAFIQEVATLIYKDLGVADSEIARWTALIALPWSFQAILGQFVDLNQTKRWWIVTMQMGIGLGLAAGAFSLQLPNAFTVSLVIFALTGIMSAFCNIAMDGFAVLSMDNDERGAYAGMMSTFFRFGRLLMFAILPWIVGRFFLTLPELPVQFSNPLTVKSGNTTLSLTTGTLYLENGLLKATVDEGRGYVVQPEVKVPTGVTEMRLAADGQLFVKTETGEKSVATLSPPTAETVVTTPTTARNAWFMVALGAAGLFGFLSLVNRKQVPKPDSDKAPPGGAAETRANLQRMFALFMIVPGAYFAGNAIVRLVAHFIWQSADGKADGPLKGWMLPEMNKVIGFEVPLPPIMVEVAQLGLCLGLVFGGLQVARAKFPGSEMAAAMGSFVKQPGFWAIFVFILFYRFPEVLVGRLTPLFLKSSLADGGLAVNNEQLGLLNGFGGLAGLIVGGILGGIYIQKKGLKNSFWALALAMHVPNLLYLYASTNKLPDWAIGPLSGPLLGLLFVDNVGYGFGFTGYMVYLIWVAKRNGFETSHYAIGTGMGALTIALAGAISSILLSAFPKNFTIPFIWVIILAIPAMLAILFIPLDDSHRQIKVDVD